MALAGSLTEVLKFSENAKIHLLSRPDFDGVYGFFFASNSAGQQAGENHATGQKREKEKGYRLHLKTPNLSRITPNYL